MGELKKTTAAGADDILAENWKALLCNVRAWEWLTKLCNKCWQGHAIPQQWHEALVRAVYEMGTVDDCDNYRPISLLLVAYKLFATIVLNSRKLAQTTGSLVRNMVSGAVVGRSTPLAP